MQLKWNRASTNTSIFLLPICVGNDGCCFSFATWFAGRPASLIIIVVVFILGRCFNPAFDDEGVMSDGPMSSLVIEFGRTRTFVTFVKSLSDLAMFPFPSLFLCTLFNLVVLFLLQEIFYYITISVYNKTFDKSHVLTFLWVFIFIISF